MPIQLWMEGGLQGKGNAHREAWSLWRWPGLSPSVLALTCGQRWPGPALLFALLEQGGSRELSLAPAGAVSLLELPSPAKLNWAQEAPGGETCC